MKLLKLKLQIKKADSKCQIIQIQYINNITPVLTHLYYYEKINTTANMISIFKNGACTLLAGVLYIYAGYENALFECVIYCACERN